MYHTSAEGNAHAGAALGAQEQTQQAILAQAIEADQQPHHAHKWQEDAVRAQSSLSNSASAGMTTFEPGKSSQAENLLTFGRQAMAQNQQTSGNTLNDPISR